MKKYLIIGIITLGSVFSGMDCRAAEQISKEEATRLLEQSLENLQAIVCAQIAYADVLDKSSNQRLIRSALHFYNQAVQNKEFTEAYIHTLESLKIMRRSGVKRCNIPPQQISLSTNTLATWRRNMTWRLDYTRNEYRKLLDQYNVDRNHKAGLELLIKYHTDMLGPSGALDSANN